MITLKLMEAIVLLICMMILGGVKVGVNECKVKQKKRGPCLLGHMFLLLVRVSPNNSPDK